MAEAVDLLAVWTTTGGIGFEVVEIGSAAAGEKEAGRMPSELEMLQIVIVAGEVEIDIVTPQQRIALRSES